MNIFNIFNKVPAVYFKTYWSKVLGTVDGKKVYVPVCEMKIELPQGDTLPTLDIVPMKGNFLRKEEVLLIEILWGFVLDTWEWERLDRYIIDKLLSLHKRKFSSLEPCILRMITRELLLPLGLENSWGGFMFRTRTEYRLVAGIYVPVKHEVLSPSSELKIDTKKIKDVNTTELIVIFQRLLNYKADLKLLHDLIRWWGKILERVFIVHSQKAPGEIKFK